ARRGRRDRPRAPHHGVIRPDLDRSEQLGPPKRRGSPRERRSERDQARHAPAGVAGFRRRHSHSIVAGGLLGQSNTTRFTPRTSLAMRLETRASSEAGRRVQSAVMPSELFTARSAITRSYDRSSPFTPTVRTGSSTANACQVLSYHLARRSSSMKIASARRRT